MAPVEGSEELRTAILYEVPFVHLVPEGLRPLVCQMFRPVRFDFGDEIVREGDPPDAMYVLTGGSARVLRERSGVEITLRHLGPGAAFGEPALIAGGPRTATVRASEPTSALRLGRDAFDAVIELHPEIGDALRDHVRVLEISDVLRLDPVFSLLPTSLLADGLSEFEAVELDPGQTLLRLGDPGDAVFVVASGRFVAHVAEDPAAGAIGYLRAGDVIGERAVISGAPRGASVTATTESRVLRINAESFRTLVAACPRFAAAIKDRDAGRDRRVGGNVPLDFSGELDEPVPETPAEAEAGETLQPAPRAASRRARRRRMPVVLQFDAADCAVAALASVARFYGRSVSLTFLRDVAGTGAEGTTLRGLCSAASAIGFDARPVKVSRDRVETISLPAVIHWDKNHWVVLYEVSEDTVVIGDPAVGLRKETRARLQDSWSGYAALLAPTDALAEAPADTASLGWVMPLLKPHRARLLVALVLALVAAGLEVLLPVIVGRIVNSLQATKQADLAPSTVALFLVVIGAVVVVWTQRRVLARIVVRFDRDSLDFLTGQLLALPMSYFAKRKVGDIERRLASMSQVRRIVVQEGVAALSSFALVLAVIVAMILQAPLLGTAFLVVLPLYGVLMWVSRRRVRPIMAAMEEALARYSASQVDLLKGVETVKTLGAEPGLRTRMRKEFDLLNERLAAAYKTLSTFDAAVQVVNLGMYARLRRAGCLLRSFGPYLHRDVRRVHRIGPPRVVAAARADVGLGRRPGDDRAPGQVARRVDARARTRLRPQRPRPRLVARRFDRRGRGGIPLPGRRSHPLGDQPRGRSGNEPGHRRSFGVGQVDPAAIDRGSPRADGRFDLRRLGGPGLAASPGT